MRKTATLHVHHAFLYISLPSLRNCNVKWPNFDLTWGRKRQGDKFYSFSLSLWTRTQSPLFSSDLTILLSNNWVTWYKGKKVSKDAKCTFQRRCHWRRRCRIVRSPMFLSTETVICIVERGKKRMGQRFLPGCNHEQENYTCQFLRLFLPYLRDHDLLRSRNSATKATVRDVTVCFVEGLMKTTPSSWRDNITKFARKSVFPPFEFQKYVLVLREYLGIEKLSMDTMIDLITEYYACKNHH